MGLVLSLLHIWLWWTLDPDDDARSRGLNALWARHSWVGEPHTEAEYDALAQRVRDADLSDVFFHAGPLEGDGTLRADRAPHAPALLAAMQARVPALRAQAYLGQVERRGGGPLDLRSARTRQNIVAVADSLLALGFDGIHYDIEPIHPGDDDFLSLLDDTREVTRRHGAVLSTSLEQLEMFSGAEAVVSRFVKRMHDPTMGFLQDVARRVDQLAIMTYDTGLPTDWLYGAHSARQTCRLGRALADEVTLFIGVPTYEEGNFWGFHPWAEHEGSGVRGVRKGLSCLDDRQARNVGIALFAEWTTDEAEWRRYQRAWVAGNT